MMEYRKEQIKGFEEYSVDTNGIVYGKTGRPLRPAANHSGYLIVNLMVDGKRIGITVHTLVAKQFLPKEDGKTQVNHKNGKKSDNRVVNLEWVSPKENVQHSIHVLGNDFSKENNPNAKAVYAKDKDGKIVYEGNSLMEIAEQISQIRGTSPRSIQKSISRALTGNRKDYLGYTWYYK